MPSHNRIAPPNQVAAWRDFRGISQATLAARAGVDQKLVTRYEAGQATIDLHAARKLAAALGATLDEVFPENDG
jgi:transcriptional regulator with XRE-family HTH domain